MAFFRGNSRSTKFQLVFSYWLIVNRFLLQKNYRLPTNDFRLSTFDYQKVRIMKFSRQWTMFNLYNQKS